MYSKSRWESLKRWFLSRHLWGRIIALAVVGFFICAGFFIWWVATLKTPDLQSFQVKDLAGSTKIYDRTGNILLYDVNQNANRQVVSFDKISRNIKHATIARGDE